MTRQTVAKVGTIALTASATLLLGAAVLRTTRGENERLADKIMVGVKDVDNEVQELRKELSNLRWLLKTKTEDRFRGSEADEMKSELNELLDKLLRDNPSLKDPRKK